jgi:hypothetical protein
LVPSIRSRIEAGFALESALRDFAQLMRICHVAVRAPFGMRHDTARIGRETEYVNRLVRLLPLLADSEHERAVSPASALRLAVLPDGRLVGAVRMLAADAGTASTTHRAAMKPMTKRIVRDKACPSWTTRS